MFQSSHAGAIVRYAWLLPTCLLLGAQPWIVSAQQVSQIAGAWRGNSVCAMPNTPCRNEANRFSCTAAKIVGGKEIVMGSGEWTYDSSKHLLQTLTPNPTIRLALDHDSLDGELILPEGAIYRRIHLKKSRD